MHWHPGHRPAGRACERVVRQVRRRDEVDHESKGHADPGGGEPVVPAKLFAERAADQWRKECAGIDADVKDRKGTVSAPIARRVQGANLGRYVRLECTITQDEKY